VVRSQVGELGLSFLPEVVGLWEDAEEDGQEPEGGAIENCRGWGPSCRACRQVHWTEPQSLTSQEIEPHLYLQQEKEL